MTRFSAFVVAAFCAVAGLPLCGQGTAQSTLPLPLDFRQALGIVPVDSESLVATVKPFSVPKPNTDPRHPPPFDEFLKWHCLASGFSAEFLPLFSKLEGREVTWAMVAKRRQEVRQVPGSQIIELGLHPYESVAIARFRDPIPAEFVEALQSGLEVSEISGIRTFRSKRGPFAILLPRPDLLVSVSMLSTDDAMLLDVARRLETAPNDHLFQAANSWAYIDTASTVWAVRKMRNVGARPQKSDGRDWVVFAFNIEKPQQARFRSVLSKNAEPNEGNPWLGLKNQVTTHKDLGLTAEIEVGTGYVDTTLTCLSEFQNRCLLLPFLIDAFGVMVWI